MKTLKIVKIFDPDGNLYNTPKGKTAWSSVSAAKNAWNYHHWKQHPKYERLSINQKWSEDAEPLGWTIDVEEYELAKKE